jgi:uncharacterized membrane protein YhdT
MTLIWFSIIGIVGLIVLLIAHALKIRWMYAVLMAVVVTALIAIAFRAAGPAKLGPERWFNVSPIRETLLFVLMVFGMVARVVSEAIERQRNTAGVAVTPQVSRWDFVYPLLVSVPTFGALLSQTSGDTLTTPIVVLSFQTGFFWQTVLKAAKPQ